MALNIKNRKAELLIAEVAKRRGTSKTQAIIDLASRELGAEGTAIMDEDRIRAARAALAEFHAHLTPEQRAFDINTELYDEHGLPK
jgi:hypothetical protein